MARELLALRRYQSGYRLGFRCNRHIACASDSSALALPSPEALRHEIAERRLAEEALHRAKIELEFRVEERTGELKKANQTLLGEIAQRQKTEEELRHSEGRFRLLVESVQDYAIFMLDPSWANYQLEHGCRENQGIPGRRGSRTALLAFLFAGRF